MNAQSTGKAAALAAAVLLFVLGGCSSEDLLQAAAETVLTTGPVTAEVSYDIAGGRVAPGFPLVLSVDWSAPCGKGGRCKEQPFAAEVDCGGIPCTVERNYASYEEPDPETMISETGRMTLEVRPGGTGRLALTLTLTQLETGEVKRVAARPLDVAQPVELGMACRAEDSWQRCPSSAWHGQSFELAVWAKAADGSYLAIEPQVTFNGTGWDAVEIRCAHYPNVIDEGFAPDATRCSGAYGIPGLLIIEAAYGGLTARQEVLVEPGA